MSPNTILEDAGQYALNASISSRRFEDLRILAFSRRISPNRVGAPRAMYANSTLVTRALPSLFQDERLDEVSDAGLALCDDISVSATYYGYGDDSDLDDDKSDGSESSEDETDSESAPSDRKDEDETPENNTQRRPVAHQAAEDAKPPPPTATSNVADPSAAPAAPAEARSPRVKAEASDLVSANTATTTKPATTPGPQVRTGASTPRKPTLKLPDTNARVALYSPSGSEGPRTVFAIDTAYRTWRAVVFYAYTYRVAFAPLRSQGLPFKLADEDDPSQLPICSPKSMYRLAMKYGNTELERLAGDDIASKLSTQNVLAELFSPFTARYPQIQDMELNFVVAHLKHPHIAVELPTWIDRFARGELKECADTFGRLIHKLACAATVTVATGGLNACPRGCAMSTVQHRCTMCGLSFN
ncbi:uncharacterized protein TRAVEDRAFT_141629 [Trametes versicolor FP-101664 SS1]|uniref:uncharacterized protein n=1 Tax=Trametes versicolor (strain FP-101664) TaxID=717944 RepID=UPI0004622FE7|nr:uncharacterized protein TRAVEDRAFT_141629 [Trametes versicolor FP-101664 SS1]EIW63017.1 hypothetical protein TRAVEDRAFT_141629 [Trametes versicolor FP-101664 SS1]